MRILVGSALIVALALPGCKRAKPAPFPFEVAGFRFGMSTAEFQARCTASGKASSIDMKRGGLRVLACDAVEVQPGWRWSVFGGFCENGGLCEISYFSTHELAAHDFDILATRFRKDLGRDGEEKRSLGQGPIEPACAKGGGMVGVNWDWGDAAAPDGRIRLVLDCTAKPAMLSVRTSDARAIATQREYAREHGPNASDGGN